MALAAVSLDDKYTLETGRVFLTGSQALARLPMMQKQRDRRAGLDTGGFISGYRGSPLGGLDQALWRASRFLDRNDVVFWPGINEDLGATAIWGSQQLGLFPGARKDGVFGMWYGKGPGVHRTGDAFAHANASGTARHGGVLVLAGDDHTPKSSTLSTQSEHHLRAAKIPVLYPANVQDFLDFGLLGWAMSRYTGLWIGFKVVADTVEASGSVVVDPDRVEIVEPSDFAMPPGGLNIRWPDMWYELDDRIELHKLPAAQAFVRANRMDRVVVDPPRARYGIVTAGKAYLDLRQAMDDLGLDERAAAEAGIRVYKLAMTWPLEPEGLRRFASGLEEIMVVEEKHPLIEPQVRDLLYDLPDGRRPRVVGVKDDKGETLLTSCRELNPAVIARAVVRRIGHFHDTPAMREHIAFLDSKRRQLAELTPPIERTPYFCSGCPHNTSTRVPEGSRALAGIGCHFMAQWMDRRTDTYTHMGAEGVPWVGQAPFSDTKHVFVNLGDGTYYHSGSLAVRACVASGVNITFKILYNDAVAMTGGQPADGPLTVHAITAQMAAEGVKRIAVVADDPGKYPIGTHFADGTTVHHRDDLEQVQRDLREWPGVSVLVYDQVCAAEKRRRRKRGTFPDPDQRVFINERVCEGCGDCSEKSNCLSVVPVETEFGRKRAIDQSSCNKDFSCLKGFCPSFVTVRGGKLRKRRTADGPIAEIALPEPQAGPLDKPYSILVTGVGGTGVVTIGALLGMAAHLEGKGVSVLDITGLAQKGGAVLSHVRLAAAPDQLHSVRVADGDADLILGCDLVVAAGQEAMGKVRAGRTRAIVNSHETPTAGFTRNPDFRFPGADLCRLVAKAVGEDRADFIEGTKLATALMGDAIAANLFMTGFAFQRGLIPLSGEAILKAIELNGVAVEMNKRAFLWGRRAAHDPAAVQKAAAPQAGEAPGRHLSESFEELVERRVRDLADYQNAAYAARYRELVDRVAAVERVRSPGMTGLAGAVARYYYKLLAYKDEYEVARLYSDPAFTRALREEFEGDYRLEFNMAPPGLARRDPQSGELKKQEFGAWMLPAFRLLARLRFLRGSALDPFGKSDERRTERRLIAEYEAAVVELIAGLGHDNHALAVEIASLPEQIRGYGHVKARHLAKAEARRAELIAMWRAPAESANAAE